MANTQLVNKTIVVENTEHLDTVTVQLELEVACSCPGPAIASGSYTRVEPPLRRA